MSQYIRPILAVLIGVGLIVLTIVLIVRGFSGKPRVIETSTNLGSYATTAAVTTLTVDNAVVADIDHRSTVIAVTNTDVSVDVIQGYQGTVIQHQSFANNTNSYRVFLKSLQGLGFALGSSDPAFSDEQGVCPAGKRYIYQIANNGDNDFRFWSTSCSSHPGTFKGNGPAVRSLFIEQVPNSAPSSLLSNI